MGRSSSWVFRRHYSMGIRPCFGRGQVLGKWDNTTFGECALKSDVLCVLYRAFSAGLGDGNSSFVSTKNHDVFLIQNLLRTHNSTSQVEAALAKVKVTFSEDLVLQVLQRFSSEWKSAYLFFCYAAKQESYSHGSRCYNAMLDILGKMKQLEKMKELVESIPLLERGNVVNERTFSILLNRYAGGHKVQEAIDMFHRREEFGLKLDAIAFQTLLLSLCRYKHVDIAESLFFEKKKEFPSDIKTMNIILNGWCVRRNYHGTKNFWNYIITSSCKPTVYTYSIYINSLTKSGRLGEAVKLFTSMWIKGCNPDVVICNCLIEALCFKKRIPEALEIFNEMNEKGCEPDTVTYSTLIKYMCKLMRMDEAYKLLGEMEGKGCRTNGATYIFFLKSMKTPEEVFRMVQKMEKAGCKLTSDIYNSILKLFLYWNFEEGITMVWNKMVEDGVGPDQRSYTIMIHGLYNSEKMDEALHYFEQMMSKGMIPEPRTHILVEAMKIKKADNNAGRTILLKTCAEGT